MEIKSHVFFSLINWDDLINKKITPPFNPNVVSSYLSSKYRETQRAFLEVRGDGGGGGGGPSRNKLVDILFIDPLFYLEKT